MVSFGPSPIGFLVEGLLWPSSSPLLPFESSICLEQICDVGAIPAPTPAPSSIRPDAMQCDRESQQEREDRVAVKWAFLVHYQWLARWFAAQATVLHRVYRGPRALTEDGDEPPARESSRSSRSGSRSTRRLMWLPDCLPSLRRNLLEICRVLQTPLPGILEERISELQAELEQFDRSLNERARGSR